VSDNVEQRFETDIHMFIVCFFEMTCVLSSVYDCHLVTDVRGSLLTTYIFVG